MSQTGPLEQSFDGDEGIDFVVCRICGDHRRVISGRHLSKHDIDRETYMEEYHLTPDELIAKAFRVIQSSRRGFYPHGKSDWIAAVKKLHKQGESVFAGDLQDKHAYLYNQGVWIFGDWDKALCVAGFDPKKLRLRTFWDRDRIIKEIRGMRDQNLPLYASHVMKNHPDLFSGAQRHFRSWNKALVAAGINKKQASTSVYKSCPDVLRALRDVLENGSREDIPDMLRLQATHYFGNLRKALRAMKADQRLLRGWSKQKIISVLSRMHRSKKIPTYGKLRREFPALLSAAQAYFGSWGKALYTAGIDPNLYFVRRKWRRPRVRCYRRSCHRQKVTAHTYTEAVTDSPRIANKR
jgi:hypothetical protein